MKHLARCKGKNERWNYWSTRHSCYQEETECCYHYGVVSIKKKILVFLRSLNPLLSGTFYLRFFTIGCFINIQKSCTTIATMRDFFCHERYLNIFPSIQIWQFTNIWMSSNIYNFSDIIFVGEWTKYVLCFDNENFTTPLNNLSTAQVFTCKTKPPYIKGNSRKIEFLLKII